VGISLADDARTISDPYRFRVAEHRSHALESVTLWMDSWQIRDNIPIGCGWLWIPSAGYPLSPPGVHEAIHELRGHCAGYPQLSTHIHDISTDLPTSSKMAHVIGLDELARDTHGISTPYAICPHNYPQAVGHVGGRQGGGTGAYLCTQGPSCPQIQACYPR
jgi:hypothetical protein